MPVLTHDERQRFLTLYQRSGLEAQCLAVLGKRPSDLHQTRAASPSFAEEMDFAYQQRCAVIEEEIDRRAVVGWEEPVFFRGEECGHIRKFSDQLLLALARRHIPAYRERVSVESNHTGSVSIDVGLETLRLLSPAAQEKLREIVVEAEGRLLSAPEAGPAS